MDELEKKAQKGLESFSKKGDLGSLKGSLDNMVDDLLGDDEDVKPSQSSSGSNMKWLYIGLAILGLCVIGYFGYKDGSNSKEKISKEPAALYAQYFEVLPDAMSANDRGNEISSELVSDADAAMQAYSKGDFERAATILTKQDEVGYVVFGAISEMKNENFENALTYLLKSKKMDGAEQYNDIIGWYLSLTYLKQGNLAMAKANFSVIAAADHYKKKEAKKILESM